MVLASGDDKYALVLSQYDTDVWMYKCAEEEEKQPHGILVLFQGSVMIKYLNKSNLGEKTFVLGQFQVLVQHSRKSRQQELERIRHELARAEP